MSEMSSEPLEQEDQVEPPVPQLADVPPEEWDYSNSQALAGCGIVGAVVLAIILPIVLGIFMDSPWDKVVGFGIPVGISALCVVVIYRITRDKRIERRMAAGEDVGEASEDGPSVGN